VIALDLLLGWTARLGPVGAWLALAALSGFAVMLVQKKASRQSLLARCRRDLRRLKERLRASTDPAERLRLRGLSSSIAGRYVLQSLKPAWISVPLLAVVAVWGAARLSCAPLRPDEIFTVRARFAEGSEGFAHLLPGPGLELAGPAISAVPGASWDLRAPQPGFYELQVRHSGRTSALRIRVGHLAPDPLIEFDGHALEVLLAPAVEPAWWNAGLGWPGLYLLVATLCALAFRRILGVR
jgi:hypothetical protein